MTSPNGAVKYIVRSPIKSLVPSQCLASAYSMTSPRKEVCSSICNQVPSKCLVYDVTHCYNLGKKCLPPCLVTAFLHINYVRKEKTSDKIEIESFQLPLCVYVFCLYISEF